MAWKFIFFYFLLHSATHQQEAQPFFNGWQTMNCIALGNPIVESSEYLAARLMAKTEAQQQYGSVMMMAHAMRVTIKRCKGEPIQPYYRRRLPRCSSDSNLYRRSLPAFSRFQIQPLTMVPRETKSCTASCTASRNPTLSGGEFQEMSAPAVVYKNNATHSATKKSHSKSSKYSKITKRGYIVANTKSRQTTFRY
eukprot:m.24828 g.24828  ORF g.24828 m.24828 type:complete len:195 (+) comp5700_c0_seq1:308-892(+)